MKSYYDSSIIVKISKDTKEKVIDKAYSKRRKVSEYIRDLIEKDLESKN